jgi:ribose/xylose/arabinose/galactoside ABC-type transport system permease subunit
MPFSVALLAGVVAGLIIGIINGTLTVIFGFPSLIVTLAMMSILRGIVYVITGNAPLPPYNSQAYFAVGNGEILNLIPVPVIISIAILILISLMLFRTLFGRVIIMTGANRKAASIAGVNTRMVVFSMFAACGLFAGIAGMLLGSKLKSVFPEFGMGYELRAITAAVIGGVSLFGGRGSFIGSFLGAILIGLIFNIIDLLALDPYWQYVVIGLMVLIAVLSDKLVYNISMRRRGTG